MPLAQWAIAPDYTRDNKSRKEAVKSMILEILPACLLMFIMGAIMSKLIGIYDTSLLLCELGIPFPGADCPDSVYIDWQHGQRIQRRHRFPDSASCFSQEVKSGAGGGLGWEEMKTMKAFIQAHEIEMIHKFI